MSMSVKRDVEGDAKMGAQESGGGARAPADAIAGVIANLCTGGNTSRYSR